MEDRSEFYEQRQEPPAPALQRTKKLTRLRLLQNQPSEIQALVSVQILNFRAGFMIRFTDRLLFQVQSITPRQYEECAYSLSCSPEKDLRHSSTTLHSNAITLMPLEVDYALPLNDRFQVPAPALVHVGRLGQASQTLDCPQRKKT